MRCSVVGNFPLGPGPRKHACHDRHVLLREALPMGGNESLVRSSTQDEDAAMCLEEETWDRKCHRTDGTERQADRRSQDHEQHVSMDALSLSPAGISLMPDDDNNCCLFVCLVFRFIRSTTTMLFLHQPTNQSTPHEYRTPTTRLSTLVPSPLPTQERIS